MVFTGKACFVVLITSLVAPAPHPDRLVCTPSPPTCLAVWSHLCLPYDRRPAVCKVIDRFGRYPHRNALLGRKNTPEEEAWLADVDNLPSWALSQVSK